MAGLLWTWALTLLQRARGLARERTGAEHDSLLVLLWLPLCSPAFAVMCGYVHRSAEGMVVEVAELKRRRYDSKSA